MEHVCAILVGKYYFYLKAMLNHCCHLPIIEWESAERRAEAKCNDLLRINSNHVDEKWLQFHSSFSYHNLCPSGKRFYLPAHFSNQTSIWDLDFFKWSPEPEQLWFRLSQRNSISRDALFSSHRAANWESSGKEQEEGIWVTLLG